MFECMCVLCMCVHLCVERNYSYGIKKKSSSDRSRDERTITVKFTFSYVHCGRKNIHLFSRDLFGLSFKSRKENNDTWHLLGC